MRDAKRVVLLVLLAGLICLLCSCCYTCGSADDPDPLGTQIINDCIRTIAELKSEDAVYMWEIATYKPYVPGDTNTTDMIIVSAGTPDYLVRLGTPDLYTYNTDPKDNCYFDVLYDSQRCVVTSYRCIFKE